MNFEKIEMYGFKSFADKAEIKFGNGITGIVGPNGCGKSNVADAIRWVLGEQSAKSLRGSNMQDVIFSGTQGRKSLSYCEVSLYFDNTNRMFSIDYNEVIITRKLFRSGESEYYINKQPARLRDIVNLLHECGIGKEGYTIIGQGKVEEIMSAKPEDRRLIFEEATGIAKFKTSKNESERKLERTHENLVRLNDILAEIENQLIPLERQAEKAKEYYELSDQLKYHELNTYIAKADGVGKAKEKINVRIQGLDEQTELRQKEYDKAQKDYDKIFTDINDADMRLKKLNDELLEKRVSMEQSSGAKRLYEEKINFMQGQIARSNQTITDNNKIIEDCKNQIKITNASLSENKETLKSLEKQAEQTSKNLLDITGKISLGEELASANQKKIIESIESLTDIKVNKGTMSIEKTNLTEKLTELMDKLDGLSVKRDGQFNEKEKLDATINDLDRAVYDLKNQISDKENKVREGNEAVARIDNTIYNLNSNITALATRSNFYQTLRDSYEGFMPAVKGLLTKAKDNPELKKRIKGVVAELIKSDKKYDIALETALMAAAQNVVTSTTSDAQYLIEYLKANHGGRITFLPISSVKPREQNISVINALNEAGALGLADKLVTYEPEYENIISNLLGNTLIVDTLENARRIADKYRFGFKIVSLDGDLFATGGSITGGSRKQDSAGLLSNDRKVTEAEEQLKLKRAEMDKAKEKKAELESARDKCLDEYTVLNDLYTEKRQQIVVEREKLSVAENNLSDLGKEIEATSDLIDVVKEKLSKLDVDFEAVTSGSSKLEKEKSDATSVADKQQAESDALKKQRDILTAESTELQVKITQTKGNITACEDELARLNNAITNAESDIERLKNSNIGAEDIIEKLRLDEEKVALSKEEQEYVNGIRSQIENIENYKLDLRQKLSDNDETRKRVNEQLTDLSDKKHAEEIALAKIDSDLEYLQQTVWENYQETYETAIKVKDENYDVTNGENEINKLRRKRSSLGAINASAIEDCKAFRERYEKMITQRDDILKAEDDLRQAIDKIKAEMLVKFDAGFKTINEHFQRIFKELFGGGRAMLELDYANTEDKLEAGVEIIAEPPGKKLQKLSLLSGGEKALTAIAILFSILKLCPMPFCVLDEIEAALDEANVLRFAQYLQKFSKETQFIVITHRKPTMELADALFGVTMEEKGVSKTVSVKLSDVSALDSEAQ